MPEAKIFPRALAATVVFLLLWAAGPEPAGAAFSAEMQKQLGESKYVYIQSQRKNGDFSQPAEIWFFVHDGSVYVGTKKTSWRSRRIAAGRTAARIHVQSATGPSFDATGEIVKDPAAWNLLYEAYAKQYPDGWKTYEKSFRDGAADGSRVLIRYTPK